MSAMQAEFIDSETLDNQLKFSWDHETSFLDDHQNAK